MLWNKQKGIRQVSAADLGEWDYENNICWKQMYWNKSNSHPFRKSLMVFKIFHVDAGSGKRIMFSINSDERWGIPNKTTKMDTKNYRLC